ncbi:MAG TPA: pyridoxamine 5'-phosphate oxidase family protein [Nocardioidaceae bacterium]|nr:pyridoxamine 5'-phosphate oxidase family protein [Nocardioidaceae bacterium]
MTPPPRSLRQRHRDTLQRLEHDVDTWVATADPATGTPYLVPLSFLWDGRTLLLATTAGSPTSRNLQATLTARLGFGPTRDLVLVEAVVEAVSPADDIPSDVGGTFAAKTGFDPRELSTRYLYFRLRPHRVQAWREADELTGRDLMRDGNWLVADD